MNICILYYDDFWQQEAGFPLNQLRNHNIFATALEDRIYICAEKQKFLPDITIDELNPDDIDIFIIPGGDTTHLFNNEKLKDFIYQLNERNKYIVGICGGSLLMGSYGLLKGKKCRKRTLNSKYDYLFEGAISDDPNVAIDGNIITAHGHAFIEVSIELGKIAGVYSSEEEAIKEYKWMKNIK